MIHKNRTVLRVLFLSLLAMIVFGCGVTGGGSTNEGAGKQPLSGVQQGNSSSGGGSPALAGAQGNSAPPPATPEARLEAYRQQVEHAGSSSARVLYDGLGSPDSAIRQFAEEWLIVLIQAQPEVKQEVEEMQKKLANPASWPYAKELLVKLENSKSSAESDNGQY